MSQHLRFMLLTIFAVLSQTVSAHEDLHEGSNAVLIKEFEQKNPISWSGRTRFFSAQTQMRDQKNTSGEVRFQKVLVGLPESIAKIVNVRPELTENSIFSLVSSGPGVKVCAIILVPQNEAQYPFKQHRERLSAALHANPSKWISIHELGHCVQSFLEQDGSIPLQTETNSPYREAFADIYSLEWMRQAKTAYFKDYLMELIKERAKDFSTHANAKLLENYARHLDKGNVSGSLCDVAWQFSKPERFNHNALPKKLMC